MDKGIYYDDWALSRYAQRITACAAKACLNLYGDARRADVLARVGAAQASAIVITLDDPAAASHAITSFWRQWPEVLIYSRARDMATSVVLSELGADHVVPETVESSLQLSAQLLAGLGFSASAVEGLIERIRRQKYDLVRPVIDASENSESSST
jgi:CPA2 family monovalent cation:H+ antiporter-2